MSLGGAALVAAKTSHKLQISSPIDLENRGDLTTKSRRKKKKKLDDDQFYDNLPRKQHDKSSLATKRRRQQKRQQQLQDKMSTIRSDISTASSSSSSDNSVNSDKEDDKLSTIRSDSSSTNSSNAAESTATTSVSLSSSTKSHTDKEIVSLLIIQGCEECEKRLEGGNNSLTEGGKTPSYIYSAGERLKAQCDPSNWTYGCPQPFSSLVNRPTPSLTSSSSQPDDIPDIVVTGSSGHEISSQKPDNGGLSKTRSLPHFSQKSDAVEQTSVLPRYLENIIHHHSHTNLSTLPEHNTKLMKKLSKSILLPEDPEDPGAFTVTPGVTRPPKAPWCSSKPVLKIVGSFVLFMSIGIILAIVYMYWFSDTSRPMHMK